MDLRQKPIGGVRLNRVTLTVGVSALVLLTGGLVVGLRSLRITLPRMTPPEQASTPVPEVGRLPLPDAISHRPKDYGEIAAQERVPPPQETPPVTSMASTPAAGDPAAVQALVAALAARAPQPPAGLTPPSPESTSSRVPALQTGHPPSAAPAPVSQPASSYAQGEPSGGHPSSRPRKRAAWLSAGFANGQKAFATADGVGPPRTKELPDSQTGSGDNEAPVQRVAARGKPKVGTLIPPATWERPVDPTRVLYWDQLIYGQLAQDVNTDIPGRVVIKITEQVEDRFGQGHVLIPQYTSVLGIVEKPPDYGQTRIPITIVKMNYPDGTAVRFTKAQVGDPRGASAIPGDVNNHWGKVIVGSGLSALLNIGVRAPFSSNGSFRPSLEQEYSEEFARGLQGPLQETLRRRFLVPPTITQGHGYPVSIQLEDNISFMSPALEVAR